MKYKTFLLVIILVLATSTFYSAQFIMAPVTQSTTHLYPDHFPNQTLQQAIYNDTVNNGDTIYVVQDIYPDQHLNVNKSITLRGAHNATTILDGMGHGTVVTVNASNVEILDFTIQNGTTGIVISSNSSSNNISRNIIKENDYGIDIIESSNNTLISNAIENNQRHNFNIQGTALSHFVHYINTSNKVNEKPIYYWVNKEDEEITGQEAGYVAIVNSTNVTVRDLALTRNSHGILFSYTTNSTIQNVNTSFNEHGVHLFNSNGNKISNVHTSFNEYGIYLGHSDNNEICGTTISDNSQFGIWLVHSSNDTFKGNNVTNNDSVGIALNYSNNNTVFGNNIVENAHAEHDYGIMLLDSNGNILHHNNFIDHEFQVVDLGNSGNNKWHNDREGNYWSDYVGLDDGSDGRVAGDGIGDTLLPAPDGEPTTAPVEARVDYYPLMNPWKPIRTFEIYWSSGLENKTWNSFTIQSNSTVASTNFNRDEKYINFTITSGDPGSCNLTIPRDLADHPFALFVNETVYSHEFIVNETHCSLYFTYTLGTHRVEVTATWLFALAGDLNFDGTVDIFDAIKLAGDFGFEERPELEVDP